VHQGKKTTIPEWAVKLIRLTEVSDFSGKILVGDSGLSEGCVADHQSKLEMIEMGMKSGLGG